MIEYSYPSRDKYIQAHAEDLVQALKQIVKPGEPLSFIAHSMGSLVLRSALNHPDCPKEAKMGRAVLYGPPNQGASWAYSLRQIGIVRQLMKPYSGKQLATKDDILSLGEFPPSMEVLVVAGDFSLNPFIAGKNDGRVSIKETYLNTPHTHIIVHKGHNTMLYSKKVATLSNKFLKTGSI